MNASTVQYRIQALRQADGPRGITFNSLRSAIRNARLSGRQDDAAALEITLAKRWRLVAAYIEGRWR